MIEQSPEFDDSDFEPILEWAECQVIDWTLHWEHGFITFDVPKDEARKAAALFIYLWSRSVYAGVAEHCASAYCNSYSVRRI